MPIAPVARVIRCAFLTSVPTCAKAPECMRYPSPPQWSELLDVPVLAHIVAVVLD